MEQTTHGCMDEHQKAGQSVKDARLHHSSQIYSVAVLHRDNADYLPSQQRSGNRSVLNYCQAMPGMAASTFLGKLACVFCLSFFQLGNGEHLVEPSLETQRSWRLPAQQYNIYIFLVITIPALGIIYPIFSTFASTPLHLRGKYCSSMKTY